MFDFVRRRRNEALKREALRIGGKLMDGVNARIEQWRAERLESRREMWEATFDERVVSIEPTEGVSFEDLLQLEALALENNWNGARDDYVKEAMLYLTDEDIEFLDMIGGGEKITQVLYERVDEVSAVLAAHLNESIFEELKRRGLR